jgi:AcrR family transcriptional regulator
VTARHTRHECSGRYPWYTTRMTSDAGARSTATGRAGRGGRRPSPGLDDQILDAALATLAEAGYSGLTLNGLAVRAGVAKTTILRRWPSKAAVAAAAVERLALQTVEIPEHGALRADLEALVTGALHVFTRGSGSFVPRLIRESGHHPEIADLLLTVIRTRRSAYRRVLSRAVARHELDPDADQDLIIDLLVGPVWTRLLITREPISDADVDGIVDAVLRAYPPPPGAGDDGGAVG